MLHFQYALMGSELGQTLLTVILSERSYCELQRTQTAN